MVAGGWRTQGPLEKYFGTPIVSQKIWTTLLATFFLTFPAPCCLFFACVDISHQKRCGMGGLIEELNKTMEQLLSWTELHLILGLRLEPAKLKLLYI